MSALPMNFSRETDTRFLKQIDMRRSVTMDSSNCTRNCVECTGILKINFHMKSMIGNSTFQLLTRISKELGI